MLRSLKMYGMAQAVTDLIEQGAPAFEAAIPMLSQLLKAELAERGGRSIAYHMKSARFPAYKDLSGFNFAASEVNEATVRTLHRCEFMDGAQNVVLIGGPGTGKTHVATALGIQAIEHHRRKIRFFSTIELVNALEQEKAKGKAGQIAEGLTKLDLVILDELGYLPERQHRLSLGSYGRPRMTEQLNAMGVCVGQRRVGRLMRQNGIQVIRSRKFKRTTGLCPAGDCKAIGREGATTSSTSRRICCSRTSLRAGRTRNALSWFAGKPLPGNRRATSPMSGPGRYEPGQKTIRGIVFPAIGVYLAAILDLYSRRVIALRDLHANPFRVTAGPSATE